MKKIAIALLISILLNLGLLYSIRVQSPFFSKGRLWNEYGMEFSGVLIFSDAKENAPLGFIQHWKVKCLERTCYLVEATLSDRTYISTDLYSLEVQKLDYSEKIANLVYRDCQISIVNETGTFICKNGATGTIGDHIRLYYKMYSIFG